MDVVVIPVYRELPNKDEILSFRQCLKVLYKHPIILVVPQGFEGAYYEQTANLLGIKLGKEYFDKDFFNGIDSYNRLLLSHEFYARFQKYNYMLIYQLDSFVFKDELQKWTKMDYDFIGAPLIGDPQVYEFTDNMVIGNGGFCIRKIKTFIDAFSHEGNLLTLQEIIVRFDVFNTKKIWKRIPLMLLMVLGYKNSFQHFISTWKHNEDNFWTFFLNNTSLELKVPPIDYAVQFSFERFPSRLYKINKGKLPFGCHAWAKYEYESFWKNYIAFIKI